MNIERIDYSGLPEHMQEGMRLYMERGVSTGSFITAVLNNDLVRAFSIADITNTERMRDFAAFLYNQAPTDSWGSKAKVAEWKKAGGIVGLGYTEV